MKLTQKQLKKLPYNLALLLLTSGASLILGFLSFGGIFAIWPVLPLAASFFVLSVAYDGEIYLQNIKGALNKLFKHNYSKLEVAKQYLRDHFPQNTADQDCPFLQDYEAQLRLLTLFGGENLDAVSLVEKERIEKMLRGMEKTFAEILFQAERDDFTPYEQKLYDWIKKNRQDEAWATQRKRQMYSHIAKGFSILASMFMSLGTTYLLVETFSAIPALAALSFSSWPLMIVPMALIAGSAYGLLTYNTITDMISKNTFGEWYNKIHKHFAEGRFTRGLLLAFSSTILITLAFALTVFTAGTWWTVAQEAKPLFPWMGRMPGLVMGVVNPIITAFSSIFFNVQNTKETLDIIDEAIYDNNHTHHEHKSEHKKEPQSHPRGNFLQKLNPFRLLLRAFPPLRYSLFGGHLASMAVTADRMPGVPRFISLIINYIIELFEDGHYFFPHSHKHLCSNARTIELVQARLGPQHGHSHDNDLPTWFLKKLFSPVIFLAAMWDSVFSKLNNDKSNQLSLAEAWNQLTGLPHEEHVTIPKDAKMPSAEWGQTYARYLLGRRVEKSQASWFGRDLVQEEELTRLQESIGHAKPDRVIPLIKAAAKPPINQHRFFNDGNASEKEQFLEELSNRITSSAA